METDIQAALREPFPPEVIGKLPRSTRKDNQKGHCKECGGYHGLPAVHLDYVGHAAVTDRLLKVDPAWTWEPMGVDDHGLPAMVRNSSGQPTALWIRLTVGGVTRIGVGSVEPGAFDAEKQLIGDALRNAAMRFGVALDLWSKADLLHEEEPLPPVVDVPEWVHEFNKNRKDRAIPPEALASVLGASATISNIEIWLAGDESRTPDKLLSLAADLKP